MGVSVSYVAGGQVDRIGSLPYPLFPSKSIPFVKGLRLPVPAMAGAYEAIYQPEVDVEFVELKVAASGYADGDWWELLVGEEKLFETIYTKELPEVAPAGPAGLVYPVPAGTSIRFVFHNDTSTSKTLWMELRFLR